jgi:signal peptidase I
MTGPVRIFGSGLGGLLAGWLLVGFLFFISGPLTGTRMLTVLSGSMSPTIHTGDAIIVDKVKPTDLRVGDVVTFRDPADRSRLITHRLRSLQISGKEAHAVTKGDANTGTEQWSVPKAGRVAVVRHRLPHAGYVVEWMRSLPGRIVLVVIPAVLLCTIELRRIWAPSRPVFVQMRLFD